MVIIIIIIIIILCASSKHTKRCKIWIFDPCITEKNYLYLILNVEIHLDAIDLGDTIKERNKAFEQLICSYENNIVNKDFTNIKNLFHAFVWLNKTMKLLMKNHEIYPIYSIPISECSNKYYEFISCICMTEQNNKTFDEES